MKRKFLLTIGLVAVAALTAGLLCGRFGIERSVAKFTLASNVGTASYAGKEKAVEPARELLRSTSGLGHSFNLQVVNLTLTPPVTNWGVQDIVLPIFDAPEVIPCSSETPFMDRDFDPRARLRKGLDLFNKQYRLEDLLDSSRK
ncbi:MAG: hypothetical protein HY043_18700 [Verrucomicrobia bacterium]|nr:hypothetical protein [Verrucomicrobiota bacterium]